MSGDSEFDKQKALLEQKVQFYENSLEEAQKREKELSLEAKNQKRDHLTSHKEISGKFEQTIKELNKKVEELSEASFEWESKFQELETKYEQEKQTRNEGDSLFKKDATKAKDQLAEVSKNYEALKKKYSEDVDQMKSVSEEELILKTEKIADLEYKIKQVEDQWEISKQKWEKD